MRYLASGVTSLNKAASARQLLAFIKSNGGCLLVIEVAGYIARKASRSSARECPGEIL